MALLSFVSHPKKKPGSNKNEARLMEYHPIEGLSVLKESEGKGARKISVSSNRDLIYPLLQLILPESRVQIKNSEKTKRG